MSPLLYVNYAAHRMPGQARIARPLNKDVTDNGRRYALAQKAQVLALYGEKRPKGYIAIKSGVSYNTVKRIIARAKEEGFKPEQDPVVLDRYIMNRPIPGRPKRIDEALEQRLIASVSTDRADREKSSEVLAYEQSISVASAQRILSKHSYTNVKPTYKAGLSKDQRAARLAFCEAHRHWTLDDWKNVIWSDETSVYMGHRRGTVRVWRRTDEVYIRTSLGRGGRAFLNSCSGAHSPMIGRVLAIYGRQKRRK